MKTRSRKKKRNPFAMISEKGKGKVITMAPPESKEGDTASLAKLIETGKSDQKTKNLSRLVGKAESEKEAIEGVKKAGGNDTPSGELDKEEE